MIKIRERQNNYGLLVAILLIIVMVLISYIAYSKGLEKSKTDSSPTTTTKEVEAKKINKLIKFSDICDKDECNENVFDYGDINIKLESKTQDDLITHNLVFTGKVDKIINLKRFVSLRIIDSEFLLIEETLNIETEINTLLLYDNELNKLDKSEFNNSLEYSLNGLEITYFTYDDTCKTEDSKYYLKNSILISDKGFNLLGTSKGPLKEKGFVC
ncbi:MAG: hypothetical protein PHG03_00785 [Bacilli bacterium]|nr:hypothetical protein [Bacilli bacterium]MDD4795081.1 hypothetical protein [Bacilli bacterium]